MRIAAGSIMAALLATAGGVPAVVRAADAPPASIRPVSQTDLRLGVVAAATPSPGPLDAWRGRLRRRFASPMVDLYPIAGKGLHVSVGSRLHARRNFAADADKATGGLLYAPRSLGVATARGGAARFAPVATLGYTQPLGAGVSLGVEGGARMGRAFGGMPRMPRPGGPRSGAPSALVNVVLGYGF